MIADGRMWCCVWLTILTLRGPELTGQNIVRQSVSACASFLYGKGEGKQALQRLPTAVGTRFVC